MIYTCEIQSMRRNKGKKGENKTARAKRKIASKSINLNKIYFKCQRQRKTIFVVFFFLFSLKLTFNVSVEFLFFLSFFDYGISMVLPKSEKLYNIYKNENCKNGIK